MMTRQATRFTPEVLISAPRRSTGVPNSTGELVLYTVSWSLAMPSIGCVKLMLTCSDLVVLIREPLQVVPDPCSQYQR